MNILFLTISHINDILDKGIYTDLVRQFRDNGHTVYIVTPLERRMKQGTEMITKDGVTYLRVKTGNIKKVNVVEKGISTLTLETLFIRAIRKYMGRVEFDLILYSTPPITYSNIINKFKQKKNAVSYLLLKDIFPQNAVDLAMFTKSNPLYWWFRHKEKKLYKVSDFIGCMSKANVDYLIRMNPYIDPDIVHICPNSIDVNVKGEMKIDQERIRSQYAIPAESTVFIYGGNLGKPQGIDFLIECLKSNASKAGRFFVVCGTGTEYELLNKYVNDERPKNLLLIHGLEKSEYDKLVQASDVGMIFLDKRFTIPNFPSRMLGYMDASKPVLAVTDKSSDIGNVIENGHFGFWSESGNLKGFNTIVEKLCNLDLAEELGRNGRTYLENNYTANHSYNIIMSYTTKTLSKRNSEGSANYLEER